jgi:hypothetical protein
MVNDVGAGVNRDLDVVSGGWAGGRVSDKVVLASVSIRRSLLAHCRARFFG